METKETNFKKTLKSNLILFLSYGILIGFIFILVTIIVKCALHDISNIFLSITLSFMSAIVIFYLLHFVCRTSTIESFKKLKLSEEYCHPFLRKMNLFFVICILLSILGCIAYLWVHNFIYITAIEQTYETYEIISPDFANQVVTKIEEEYESSLLSKLSSTIILELSLVVSFFSLIPYQKRMLEKYNKSTD